jgi:hypothetical protein
MTQKIETTTTEDNIHIQIFDADAVPTLDAARDTEPKREYQTHNTTRDRYHETVIAALNGVTADLTVDALVLGDSTAATANIPSGDPLGNETFRTTTTDTNANGKTFTASVFIDSTEGVGQIFEEAALLATQSGGNDLPINRFKLNDPSGLLSPKSEDETVTIDIRLRQTDA